MSREIPKNQLIMGIHAISEVLKSNPLKLVHVFAQKDRKSEITDLCKEKKIPITFCSFDALSQMVGTESHQSFVAQVPPREYLSLKEFLEVDKDRCTVLMLDQIFDPQNFGALLRSAECFGVDAVVFSKNRGADITPSVTKASCGASEILPIIRVSNLAEAVRQFQGSGFEAVASVLSDDAKSLSGFKFQEKTLLVVGSEGDGIQPLIQKRCDQKVYIPMEGQIQSLNVAQATSILLYAAKGGIDSSPRG